MSRLYSWVETDTIKTTHTARGNQNINVKINYGSRSESKLAVRVNVVFDKDAKTPKVYITTGNDIEKELWSEC